MNDKTFIIAEIGINHNGSIDVAKQLIDLAKSSGCDAVKFQKRTIDIVYTKEELDKERESPWGTTQRQQKLGLEFEKKEFDIINTYCEEKNIKWFASAWDVPSLHFLDSYNPKYHKVASAMITNIEFLNEVAKKGKYTFISTGMSNYEIIEIAVNIFKDHKCEFELMHSVSAYPCPEERLNLHQIQKLRDKFKSKVGYSGHEPSVSPSIIAVSLGASSLERHITIDRSMYGSDQSASLEGKGIFDLVAAVRKIPKVIGYEDKEILDIEIPIAKKLRYWES